MNNSIKHCLRKVIISMQIIKNKKKIKNNKKSYNISYKRKDFKK